MAVDRSGAQDAQLLEDHRARNDELLHRLLDVAAQVHERLAGGSDVLQPLLQRVASLAVLRGGADGAQMLDQRADVARDGHLVVVEDDDHRGLRLTDAVERLERHAAGQGGVSDERDHLLVAARKVARHGNAVRDGQGVGGMPRGMHVAGALAGLREARDTAVLAQRAEPLEPSRDQLVGVGLVAHVEHEFVMGAVDHAVHGEDDLHRAERRGDVPACLRRHADDLLADLVREDPEFLVVEQLKVGRRRHCVENALLLHDASVSSNLVRKRARVRAGGLLGGGIVGPPFGGIGLDVG